jgi:hypothetical protein
MLSVISYQLSVISYQLSVISYQLSVISYQLSVTLGVRRPELRVGVLGFWGFMKFPHFPIFPFSHYPYALSVPRCAVPAFPKMVRSIRAGGQEFVKRFQPYHDC